MSHKKEIYVWNFFMNLFLRWVKYKDPLDSQLFSLISNTYLDNSQYIIRDVLMIFNLIFTNRARVISSLVLEFVLIGLSY